MRTTTTMMTMMMTMRTRSLQSRLLSRSEGDARDFQRWI